MPVTAGKLAKDVSQREQYAKPGFGRTYWDFRDRAVFKHVVGKRILDTGCGEGVTLEKLVRLFPDCQVEGIDADPLNIEICRRHHLPVQKGDVYGLPFSDGVFDCCVFMEVIEHLDDPQQALRELARITRPGGRLLILYPVDWVMLLARIACLRFREAAFDPGHVRQWNTWSLARMLKRTGFRVVRTRGLPLFGPLSLHVLVVAERTAARKSAG